MNIIKKEKNKSSLMSLSREQILLAVLIILILVILFLLIKGFLLPKLLKSSSESANEGPKAPSFLSTPLPSLKRIESALESSKLDELKFYNIGGATGGNNPETNKPETLEELAKRMKIEKMGRPNPFLPFEVKTK